MRAISSFSLEAGTSTFWCRALIALRMRASMSATGSVNLIALLLLRRPFASTVLADRGNRNGVLYTPQFAPGRRLRLASGYQDDLETPGISPRSANPRKHRRQMPNLRRNARGRPQSWQRLCLRVENLGFLASLTRFAVVAMQPFRLSH